MNALPLTLRQAMLRDGHARLARFLEVMTRSDANLGVQYSVKSLHIYFEGIYSLRGLQNLLNFFTKEYTIFSKEDFTCRNPVKKRGRPTKLYYIPTMQQFADFFDEPILVDGKPLNNDDLTSMRQYRKALHRQQIRRGQHRWKKKDRYPATSSLAANVGVTRSVLWRYEREMHDLVRRRRFEDVAIKGDITPQDVLRGAYIVWIGQVKHLRYPLPSSRHLKPSTQY